MINWDAVWGGLFGAMVTGGFATIGHLISRRTNIDTKNIDDRSAFTKDLMQQLEETKVELQDFRRETRIGESQMRRVVRLMQRREFGFIRLLTSVDTELRLLNMHMSVHRMDLDLDPLPREKLIRETDEICASWGRVMEMLNKEQLSLMDDIDFWSEERKDADGPPSGKTEEPNKPGGAG